MTDSSQNPGRNRRYLENDGDGDKYFDNYRYTPFTTDTEFFRDPKIHESDEVPRSTQDDPTGPASNSDPRPHGERLSDERIQEEVRQLLEQHAQVDASDVRVDVQNGVVTLSGSVDSREEKRIAEKISGLAFGVLEVKNNINTSEPEP